MCQKLPKFWVRPPPKTRKLRRHCVQPSNQLVPQTTRYVMYVQLLAKKPGRSVVLELNTLVTILEFLGVPKTHVGG